MRPPASRQVWYTVSMSKTDALPTIAFETPTAWETWLRENHTTGKGLWLKLAKKDAGVPSVTYAEALDVALCYGWIDGQKAAFDTQFWLQKFTPRGSKSIWSKINCDKAEALIAAGKMQSAGLRQIELARADGRWEAAYASQRTIDIPDDFQRALDENPQAKAFFATLNSANRYAVLFRIHTAKKPETRAARIRTLTEMLNREEKIHP
jgi:uncharacterized protein YdeI (YjbR/CyaY-like superfamily)